MLDQYVKRELKCKYYVRYVDDFVILGESTKELNENFEKIREYIAQNLHIELHPRKKLINKAENGIDFVGFIIKPGRIFMRKKTRNKMFETVKRWRKSPHWFEERSLQNFRRSINSYIGMMIHLNEFKMRYLLADMINSLFITMSDDYSKVLING